MTVPNARLSLFHEISRERDDQDAKHGGPEHDKTHTISEWKNFIVEHAYKANDAAHHGKAVDARQHLVEVAALAVAAIEALDHITAPVEAKRKRRHCPKCGDHKNVATERRPNGDSICHSCGHKGKTATFPMR